MTTTPSAQSSQASVFDDFIYPDEESSSDDDIEAIFNQYGEIGHSRPSIYVISQTQLPNLSGPGVSRPHFEEEQIPKPVETEAAYPAYPLRYSHYDINLVAPRNPVYAQTLNGCESDLGSTWTLDQGMHPSSTTEALLQADKKERSPGYSEWESEKSLYIDDGKLRQPISPIHRMEKRGRPGKKMLNGFIGGTVGESGEVYT